MNPRIIGFHMDAFIIEQNKKAEYDNYMAHLQGHYILLALYASVGNMFSKKGSKPFEYPEKPYEITKNKEELSEDEIKNQREAFLAQLMVMKTNFELSKKEEV